MLQETTLSGERVQLEPLRLQHAPALWEAAQTPENFEFFFRRMASLVDIEAFIEQGLELQDRGVALPFAIHDLESGQLVGSTRFHDFSGPDRAVEIGATWLSSAVWRTRINTECKFLLLRHAFETLDLVRVCLKTDARNQRSQRAIERIGAQKEGVLRQHMILPDGFVRDSVYYSILDSEWPDVKSRLEGFLAS
ncbi:Protein N-acetyltransferase, RimJ/RimL family [Abditibacterium utsteinense]|uniref:Protein N-acetyltransferase, RimJ/RimL family n=1 Tax=Abditibacterium utsteinense TaxID=1960156 RepID=A0A2S8SRQ8_9BACT|nr:GNAT family protein [Abditibacterium utsteinense]PQV63480.1 Protein N-acetyltransferase, RimJ/RimL family [Abditibacterium utsteinense]